jgi:hypothetical protein
VPNHPSAWVSQRSGPPFSFDEIALAVRLRYDEPLASEQLTRWAAVFASAAKDPDASSYWIFPVELMAALVVAQPDTAPRVTALRPHGDAAFETEAERLWQNALAAARARAGRVP